MQIDLDPEGRKVVIFGDVTGARQALRRFISSGATVTLATPGPTSSSSRIGSAPYAMPFSQIQTTPLACCVWSDPHGSLWM